METSFSDLPNDMMNDIWKLLDVCDRDNFRLCCKRFGRMFRGENFEMFGVIARTVHEFFKKFGEQMSLSHYPIKDRWVYPLGEDPDINLVLLAKIYSTSIQNNTRYSFWKAKNDRSRGGYRYVSVTIRDSYYGNIVMTSDVFPKGKIDKHYQFTGRFLLGERTFEFSGNLTSGIKLSVYLDWKHIIFYHISPILKNGKIRILVEKCDPAINLCSGFNFSKPVSKKKCYINV